MKIKLESIDFTEDTLKRFASMKCGWQEKVLDSITNQDIDNPIPFMEAISEKYGNPIWNDVADFNVQEIIQQAQAQIDEAKANALEQAKQIVVVSVE